MKVALVTGANRGIGLEICRQLIDRGCAVHAVCRQTSKELSELTAHVITDIDVGSNACIVDLNQSLGDVKLDLVFNVAGLLESMSWENLNWLSIEKQFQINAVGPLRIVKALENRIVRNGKVIMVTSRMGSITDNTSGGSYGYRMSKAALNIASVSLAHDLKSKHIAVGIVHPGYVRTAMTGFSGHIDSPESARGVLARCDELTLENSGHFWHQNGESLPW